MNFFLGQIGIYGFNFNPRGWALCAGSILPIAQNTALYSLIGTTYGGNGQSTFGLPDMRGRVVMGMGNQTSMGEMAGMETVTLTINEMAQHSHAFNANGSGGTQQGLTGGVFAEAVNGKTGTPEAFYHAAPPSLVLNPGIVSLSGSNQPHSNIQPYLTLNYCIATTGYYPSRN